MRSFWSRESPNPVPGVLKRRQKSGKGEPDTGEKGL